MEALAVLCVADRKLEDIESLLGRYGIELTVEPDTAEITASFWGSPEAGIVRNRVYVRADTPIHSMLHECAHIICMTAERRRSLNGDAGGTDLEEAAVCYLQIILADFIGGVGRDRLIQDMDTWGYSFRLGNTRRWFETDAGDASEWLQQCGLLTDAGQPVWRLRQ
ncbi:MAG: hypothetical protein GXP15_09605 [Gammaproteobacteria bacterium]|nr:hypothetical protein [Gammaproteobacteria bacterium]